jgi:nicotinamide-nucleotide amidase
MRPGGEVWAGDARGSVSDRIFGTAEVVTIGDELLLGHTLDTNAAFISRELGQVGIRVTRRATVGDNTDDIADGVSQALDRAAIVICTGGLGPTQDDLTRSAVARVFDVPIDVRSDLLEALRERYRQRGMPMPERNITQAEVPRGAHVLPNVRGTAPGLALTRADGHTCILLPGVPHELRALFLEQVLPYIITAIRPEEAAPLHPIRYVVVRTTGIAESAVADRVDSLLADIVPLTVAFLPGFAGTDLRITSWGLLGQAEADRALERAGLRIRELLRDHVYGAAGDDLASVVGQALRARGWRLAVAESCTGGLLSKVLTDAAGASDFFDGGVIAYSNDVKQALLAVASTTLEQNGAVSEATAREMALGVRNATGADVAIAITGIAGPGGAVADKPVGTVWIAAATPLELKTRRIVFPGDREEIRERAAQAGLALLWRMLVATVSADRSAPQPS